MLQLVSDGLAVWAISYLKRQDLYKFSVYKHIVLLPYDPWKETKTYQFHGIRNVGFVPVCIASRLASETASPNVLKQGLGVNSITWCTFVTSKPCSRYHLKRGVASRTLSPFILPIKLRRAGPWFCVPPRTLSCTPQYPLDWFLCF